MNTSILFKKSFQHAALISVVTLAAFGTSNSFAGKSASADAAATVFEVIAIERDLGMQFGKFAPGTGGTLILSTADNLVGTGLFLSTDTDPHAATFDVTGTPEASFGVTITSSPLTHTDGTASMAFATHSVDDGLDSSLGQVTDSTLDNIAGNGEKTITVGGALTVDSDQLAGSYTGSVTVDVEYN
jgi:hypothetical protein